MASTARGALVARYRQQVQDANNESAKKERLILLLADLFGQEAGAREKLEDFPLGAERWIAHIKLQDRIKTGRADTVSGTTIIEFERDLRQTGDHALDQLREYVYGQWEAGHRGPFTLIASDCLTWRVYAPHYSELEAGVASAHTLTLEQTDELVVGDNADDVFFFLDRYLFATQPIRPTLDGLKRDFGETSGVFLRALDALRAHFPTAQTDGAVQVAYEQWGRMLAIAYGDTFEGGADDFLVHTYLSVLAKVLAYEVLSGDPFIDDGELKGLLTGSIFDDRNVHNFVEQDFFAWVADDAHLDPLRPMLQAVTQQVCRYDFSDVDEDILKGVYQELIDLDTRHALGEYYTPDWLCERVVAELPIERHTRVLDPACGSGSFLRAAVARLRREHPDLGAGEIAERVVGIELHPLSVQIAKTTLLLALGPGVRAERQPVRLRVYLANTLYVPTGAVDLFGEAFVATVDGQRYGLSTAVLQDPALFDAAVTAADELADRAATGGAVTPEALRAVVKQRTGHALPENTHADFWTLFEALRDAKAAGRDSIWRFILQNTYKPYFLKEQFDVVVGNPPWLTYSQVTVADYQDEIRELAETYRVLPERAANRPHLEIAAVFLSHAARMFLKPRGAVAFVLPRSFLSADHHKAWRSGRAEWVRLTEIWDLDGVSNLFPVPACVLFGERAHAARKPPADGLPGGTVHGRLREHNATWEEAQDHLDFRPVTWHVGHLGQRTAFTTRTPRRGRKVNAYKSRFRQGATIVPRNLFFVEVTQDVPDLDDRLVTVRTDREVQKLAKPPWKAHTLQGRVHSRFLYRTAQSRSLLPFVCVDPSLVVLPVLPADGDRAALAPHAPDRLLAEGYLDTADWFTRADAVWDAHRTQRNRKNGTTLLDWLDYSGKLTSQSSATRYLVLYTSSAKDANACVIDQGTFDRPFVVDHVSYWYGTDDRDEADFLAAFLNAETPNRIIKDFQARGLFGARHVHKTILDVPLPAFDGSVRRHRRLAALGRQSAERAAAWAAALDGEPGRLGTLRLELRAHLAPELDAIDAELDKLV